MQYDLVFEGGGAKGMSFVGALQAFTEAGHTHGRIEHLARIAEKPVSFGLGPDTDTERAEAAADKLAHRLLG